jgi:hypothetical protein
MPAGKCCQRAVKAVARIPKVVYLAHSCMTGWPPAMSGARSSKEKCWRLWIPALGRSFGAPMVNWTISMPENRSLALAARSDSCRCRTLNGIHSVVDRMQRSACPFDGFGCNRPLHSTTGMDGAADTARNKQPGEEAHLYPQATKRPHPKTTLAAHACGWIRQSEAARQTDLSAQL